MSGPVQVRARYYIGGVAQSVYSDSQAFTVDASGLGNTDGNTSVGPGDLNLVTGNFAVSSSDASLGGMSVSRVFNSRNPAYAIGLNGPGWVSSLDAGVAPYVSLHDGGDVVTITTTGGSPIEFSKASGGSTHVADDSNPQFTLSKSGSTFKLIDESGTVTTFTQPSLSVDWVPASVTMRGLASGQTIHWQVAGGVEQPTTIDAPDAPSVSCGTLVAGCREIKFNYASSTTATGTSESNWGDYSGQLKWIKYTAWDNSVGAMTTTIVARYLYDNAGYLRTEWDPRIGTSDKTRYTYNSDGEVATITPPGLNAWTLAYATISGDSNPGRLASVSRPGIPSGTETTTVVYDVPVSGSGAPYNLSPSEAARWAQQDTPTDATAVFPADEVPSGPPSDYDYASVYYLDVNGRLVNMASPSPSSCTTNSGDCYISTTEYGIDGLTTRTLTAENRSSALNASSTDGPADEAVLAAQLDYQADYSSDGTELTDRLGPAHLVDMPPPNDDTIVEAREHTHYSYDQSPPASISCPCFLPTTITSAASPMDGSSDFDVRTSTNVYDIGTNTSGWTLDEPLEQVADPSGLDIVRTTEYDTTTGQRVESRMPAGPSGGDAHSADFVYWTAGTNPLNSSCGGQPQWAELPCNSSLAAQPGTSGLPDIPSSTAQGYNVWDEPLSVEDALASGAYVDTTETYDAAGRASTIGLTSSTGTAMPSVANSYDPSSQLPDGISAGTLSIGVAYDNDGRLHTYTDADGEVTTYAYDLADRVTSVSDSKATVTFGYHGSGENRGLPTSVTDSVAGTFYIVYGANGEVTSETLPSGLIVTYRYDPAGDRIHVDYTKSGSTWYSDDVLLNVHDDPVVDASTLSTNSFTYDAADRIASVQAYVQASGCVTRSYTFDSDTNRTALSTYQPDAAGNCTSSGGVTASRTYDAADRADITGYSYDAFGRITQVPASDSPSGQITSLSYYVNDAVNTIATGGITDTLTYDPSARVRTLTSTADGQTRTFHYRGSESGPSWISENSAGSTWTRPVRSIGGVSELQTSVSGTSTIALEVEDLKGDVVASADPAGSGLNVPSLGTDEYGRPNSGTARFAFKGGAEVSTDTASGLVLMGARVYDPVSGRFLQTDSVDGGSANAYDYALGNPETNSDVSGRCTFGQGISGAMGTAWLLRHYTPGATDDDDYTVNLYGTQTHYVPPGVGTPPRDYTISDWCEEEPALFGVGTDAWPFASAITSSIKSSNHTTLLYNFMHWFAPNTGTYFGVPALDLCPCSSKVTIDGFMQDPFSADGETSTVITDIYFEYVEYKYVNV